MTKNVRPKVGPREVLMVFGRSLPWAVSLLAIVIAIFWKQTFVVMPMPTATATQIVAVTATEVHTEPTSSPTVAATKTEVPTTPSATPAKIPTTTPTQAPAESMVTETAEELVQIPDPKFWVEFAHGDSKSPIAYKVGDVCYSVPQAWAVSSTLNEKIDRCSIAEAIDLSKLEKLPETLAVTPRGSKPAHNYEEIVGNGNESLDDARDGYSRVCSLSLVEGDVTYYRIGVMNEAFEAKPSETGQCYEVKNEGSNVHMLTLRYIGQLNDVIDDGTYFYSVELPYPGNWLGDRPLERLSE